VRLSLAHKGSQGLRRKIKKGGHMTDEKRKQLVDWAMSDFKDLVELIEVAQQNQETYEAVKQYLQKAGLSRRVLNAAIDEAAMKEIRRYI
jgi:hypothetical protein